MEHLVEAMQAKDVAGVVDCFAPDAELRSPITRRIVFRGREQIREILDVVYPTVGPIRVDRVVRDGDWCVLLVSSSVRGTPIEEAMVARLDADGLVQEMALYVRAMPQLVVFAAAIGPPLARRRGRLRGLAMSAMLAPVAALVRSGEPAVIGLTGVGTPSRRA